VALPSSIVGPIGNNNGDRAGGCSYQDS